MPGCARRPSSARSARVRGRRSRDSCLPSSSTSARVAELDRDSPRLLGGRRSVSTPVSALTSRVLPWSMWPAVPIVSGAPAGAPPRRALRPRRARRASTSSSATVRQSSSVRPSRTTRDHRRLAEPEPVELELAVDRARRRSAARGERQRAAAGAGRSSSTVAADQAGEPLGAGAHVCQRLAQHAQGRDVARAPAPGSR